MEELIQLVIRARAGDHVAYEKIVRRFQDMAVGYGFAVLRDMQLAEDAAQEAFVNAYADLPALQEPAAFPGWFRRIVHKQVDRVRRRWCAYIQLDQMPEIISSEPGPAEIVERHELRKQMSEAIEALPKHQRAPLTLFYIDGYSQDEISSFLEIPVGTVKSRLHGARIRLKERIITMLQEHLTTQRPSRDDAFTQKVLHLFEDLIGRFGEHVVAGEGEVYVQPYVYLSFHLIQMRTAGWTDIDFDQLAAVSGASALFGYEPGSFMPKYAHLHVNPVQRIADATGFGYEWVDFQGIEGTWNALKNSIDTDRPVKGWYWENTLFSNYRDADEVKDRQVFAMAGGPDTFAKWWSWDEFAEWFAWIEQHHCHQFGRHTKRVPAKPAKDIALTILNDLVAWSAGPPQKLQNMFPKATFGLAGIEAYANGCEHSDLNDDWVACHDINPQWSIRNSTGVYLNRIARADMFPADVNKHLLAAAKQYRAAYESWQAFYALLGHKTTEEARK